MRHLVALAFLASGGCLSTSVTGFGSAGSGSTGKPASSSSAASAASSGTAKAASSGGSSNSGSGPTSGGSAATGGSTTAAQSTCGGSNCKTGEYCDTFFSVCQPLLDCDKGGGFFPGNHCLTDGGTLGSCCPEGCVDLTSASNCGACGLACPSDMTCDLTFDQGLGRCQLADGGCDGHDLCPVGESCFPGIGCLSPRCDGTNLYCSFDGGPGACCGDACAPAGIDCGGSCPLGSERSTTNYGCTRPDGGLACSLGAVCPPGTICSDVEEDCAPVDSCTAFSSSFGLDCPFGSDGFLQGICCGTGCTDTSQDPNNCSGCGVVCPSGICVRLDPNYELGECLPSGPTDDCPLSCPSGSVCANGQCIDASCGNSTLCIAENGTIGMCCKDGSCAHPLDDPLNCGVCGNACGPGGSCVDGSCTSFPGCGLGRAYAYCNVDAGPDFLCCPGSGCTNITTDPNNCGACGFACPGFCAAGQCA